MLRAHVGQAHRGLAVGKSPPLEACSVEGEFAVIRLAPSSSAGMGRTCELAADRGGSRLPWADAHGYLTAAAARLKHRMRSAGQLLHLLGPSAVTRHPILGQRQRCDIRMIRSVPLRNPPLAVSSVRFVHKRFQSSVETVPDTFSVSFRLQLQISHRRRPSETNTRLHRQFNATTDPSSRAGSPPGSGTAPTAGGRLPFS